MTQHDWIPSTLGHGETMCKKCSMTNREAAVLGLLNNCGGTFEPKPITADVVPLRAPAKQLTLRFTMTVIRELTVDPRDYSDDGVTPEPVDLIIAAELNALEQDPMDFLEKALETSSAVCTGFTVERVK